MRGAKDMTTTTKPIQSVEINEKCSSQYEKIADIIRNPAKPNALVHAIFSNHKSKRLER